MPNMDDYLDWRGDVSFDADPFNEVDACILCELVYTRFEGVVPMMDMGDPVPINKVAEDFFTLHSDEEIKAEKTFTRLAPFLMRRLVKSKRYIDMTLSDYVDEISMESDVQLCAVTYHLNGGLVVCFRGTDATLAGWKEDLMLSYKDHTNGQRAAAIYLEYMADKDPDEKDIIVAGHSKGGNLAMYAAAFCSEETKERISRIYNLDGPGFSETMVETDEYIGILKKVKSYSPSVSLVGALLERKYPMKYVASSEKFIMQHDLLSWQVMANRLVEAEYRSNTSLFIEDVLDKWLMEVDEDTRESIVTTLFDILGNMDIETFPEITEDMLTNVKKMYAAATGLPKDKQKETLSAILNIIKIGGMTALTGR